MKPKLDIMFGIIIAMLIVLYTIQFKQYKNLQTQVDELRVLFNEKFLQEMVINKPMFRIEI